MLDCRQTPLFKDHGNRTLTQADNINIIDDDYKTLLTTKFTRTTSFYLLPKVHKANNPGCLIVNSIGSLTEKLSAYVDGHIRPLVPSIPTYTQDTTQFIHIIDEVPIDDLYLLVTIDESAL